MSNNYRGNIRRYDNKKFVKEATKMLTTMGAKVKKPNEKPYDSEMKFFELNTKSGLLNIILDTNNTFLFTAFSQFENVEKAVKNGVECNPHSGKYNFHKTLGIDDAIIAFEHHFLSTLHEKDRLKYQVLRFEFEQIRESLYRLMFNTDFTYFADEIKSYQIEDLKILLTHLEDNN